jgi:capsid protein
MPFLELQEDSEEFNLAVEQKWLEWSRAINLGAKLRAFLVAYYVDGEAFLERIRDSESSLGPQLELRLSEADLWTDPNDTGQDPLYVDGIRYTEAGRPVSYTRLRQHPGDNFGTGVALTETIDAENVVHFFRADRPDQRRGVSHLAPALSLLAELRRYRLATVSAAEIAADHSGVMYSDASAFNETPDELDENFLAISLERRALLTLPAGWKMSQLRAEQPTTEFGNFSDHLLMELGRCLQQPLNIVSGSSRDYNFASGRLDYLLYWSANDIDRYDLETQVLDRIFQWWMDEALLIPGYLPPRGGANKGLSIRKRWVFRPRQPIDIEAQANADQIYQSMGLLTDQAWASREGLDLEEHYAQLEQQQTRRRELELPINGATPEKAAEPPAETNGAGNSRRASRGARATNRSRR